MQSWEDCLLNCTTLAHHTCSVWTPASLPSHLLNLVFYSIYSVSPLYWTAMLIRCPALSRRIIEIVCFIVLHLLPHLFNLDSVRFHIQYYSLILDSYIDSLLCFIIGSYRTMKTICFIVLHLHTSIRFHVQCYSFTLDSI